MSRDNADTIVDAAADKVIDTTADVAGEMASQLKSMENTIRSLNRAKVQFYLLGMAVGGLTGAVIAYKVAYKRAETKYSKIMDTEIAEVQEHYRAKSRALDGEAAKGDLGSIVAERGYVSEVEVDEKPPMVVKPPTPAPDRNATPTNVEVNVSVEPPAPQARNIFEEAEITHEWDWLEERKRRSPDIPYVIHYDERHDMDYQEITLTYYDGDDVLCDERDTVMGKDERDAIIGEANLNRFGHGSNDANIVYVRNDRLELIYEICRSPNHYAEEVHGFSHDSDYSRNLERMRIRERNESED